MNKFVIVLVVVYTALVCSVAGKKDPCDAKKQKKRIGAYNKCLKKGFPSSLGCLSAGDMQGKQLKKCKKIEKGVKKCGYDCKIIEPEKPVEPEKPASPDAEYKVAIKTADVADAGTDSWVYMTIDGSSGSTSEKGLDNWGNDMVRGNTDVYLQTQENVGEFECIRFRIDGKDGWMPESIQVYKDQVHVYESGKINIWLDSYKTLKFCKDMSPRKDYRIFIKTDDQDYSGTDDWVYMKIQGSKGWTNEIPLDISGNDMVKGATDIHEYSLEDVGDVQCVQFRLSGTDGWRVKQVLVYFGDVLAFDSGVVGILLDNSSTENLCG